MFSAGNEVSSFDATVRTCLKLLNVQLLPCHWKYAWSKNYAAGDGADPERETHRMRSRYLSYVYKAHMSMSMVSCTIKLSVRYIIRVER